MTAEAFVGNVASVGAGLLVGYCLLLIQWYTFDCWKRAEWDEAVERILGGIPEKKLYLRSSGKDLSAYLRPAISEDIHSLSSEVRSLNQKYRFGKKTISLLEPSASAVLVIVIATLLGAFGVTVLESGGSVSISSTMSSLLSGAVPNGVSVLQWIVFGNFKQAEPEMDGNGGMPVRWVDYRRNALGDRPFESTVVSSSQGFRTILESNRNVPVDQLGEYSAYMFVSIKSPKFSSAFFSYVLEQLRPRFREFLIVMVEGPYIANLRVDYSGNRLQKEKEKLSRIRDERVAEVGNSMQRLGLGESVGDLTGEWEEFEGQVPPIVREEVGEALGNRESCFYQDAVSEVCKVMGLGPTQAEEYLGFFRMELPVLLSLYYWHDKVADIYPGENSPLFWKLERGRYREELPRISKKATNNPLVYLRVERRG